MFLDYGTNVGEYARWQALFREHQPPTLLMWGKNDPIFPEADLTDLKFHIMDSGHFALEECGPAMVSRMLAFLDRVTD